MSGNLTSGSGSPRAAAAGGQGHRGAEMGDRAPGASPLDPKYQTPIHSVSHKIGASFHAPTGCQGGLALKSVQLGFKSQLLASNTRVTVGKLAMPRGGRGGAGGDLNL